MAEIITKKKRNPLTDKSFLVFTAVAFIVGSICYAKGKEVFSNGLEASSSLLLTVLPRMVGAFVMAGFVQVLVPKDLIIKWIGEKSGLKGILIASLAGICTPAGPMLSFPLMAALYKLGADYGSLVAYLTSWELMGIMRIVVWEIPFMGMKFALLRLGVSLILPILAGMTARKIMLYFGDSLELGKG